jgi:hypothetical protein
MIRLLSALVAGAILAVSFPSTAHAASPATNKQIARTFQQLKRLPNAGAGAPRVRQFLRKLAILNPKGASTYYKFAIRKLSPADAERAAGQLLRQVTVIVQKSGLPDNQINRITKVITKTFDRFVPPTPTPTPYQASISAGDPIG